MKQSKILVLAFMGVLFSVKGWAVFTPVPKEKQEVYEAMSPDLQPLSDYNRNFMIGNNGQAVALTKSYLLATDEAALRGTGGGKPRALSIAYLIALVAADMEHPEENIYMKSVDDLKKEANDLFYRFLKKRGKNINPIEFDSCVNDYNEIQCDKAFSWSDLADFVKVNREKILKLSPRLKQQSQPQSQTWGEWAWGKAGYPPKK